MIIPGLDMSVNQMVTVFTMTILGLDMSVNQMVTVPQ